MNVWAHFYKILFVFDVPYQPRGKGMPGKSYNYQKLVKDTSNLFLFFILWWSCLCEKDWLWVGKDIKKILKFLKKELRLLFHSYILIHRKCPLKTLFQHTDYAQPLALPHLKFFLITPLSKYKVFDGTDFPKWGRQMFPWFHQLCQITKFMLIIALV